MVHDRGVLSRRTVVVGAFAAFAAAGLGGCRGAQWYPSEITPEEYVLRSVIADKRRAVARYEAALEAGEGPVELLERLLAHHRHHLRVLRGRLPDRGGVTGGAEEPEPSPDAEPSPPPLSVAALRVAEESAAGARPRQLTKVADPGLAQLIASVGACETGHAHLLREEG